MSSDNDKIMEVTIKKIICINLFIAVFIILSFTAFAFNSAAEIIPTSFVRSKVATTKGGIHSTTRGTIRLVFTHKKKWLLLRGSPNAYHFSRDGVEWTGPIIAKEASRNVFIEGNTIYSLKSVLHPEGGKERKIQLLKGTILDNMIEWGPPRYLDSKMSYYHDMRKDGAGHYTITGRAIFDNKDERGSGIFRRLFNTVTEPDITPMIVQCMRSTYPDRIDEWEPPIQCIHHVSNSRGSVAHENIPLERGQSYVIGKISVDGEGKLYGNLFDGNQWQDKDVELASGMSTVFGDDRRMSAEYDQNGRKIHLVYVDGKARLWYRTGVYPFDSANWSEPVLLKKFPVFTVVLSLDQSTKPSTMWLVYGKTIFKHKDVRWESGELYLEKFDGSTHSDPLLVSEPGTEYNWYPNMNEDVSKNIGIMYLKGMTKNQASVNSTTFDIMFFSTGQVRN
jgi:hypothetical protein